MRTDPSLHYLDNAATTIVDPEVAGVIHAAMLEHWANPSSLYPPGAESEAALAHARAALARTVGCKGREFYFTSCGSEGNNLALLGAARTRTFGKKIVCSGFEHPSVRRPLEDLAAAGWQVVFVPPAADGSLDVDRLLAQVDRSTVLAACMMVNNETGAVCDVIRLAAGVKQANPRTFLHVDGVQAWMRLPVRLEGSGIDSFTRDARQTFPDERRLQSLRRTYFLEQLSDLFGFEDIRRALNRYLYLAGEQFIKLYPQQIQAYQDARWKFNEEVADVAEKFSRQYTQLVGASEDYMSDSRLHGRISSGAAYFKEKLEELSEVFSEPLTDSDNKESKKKLKECAKDLSARLNTKIALLDFVIENGFTTASYLRQRAVLSLDGGRKATKARTKEKQPRPKAEKPEKFSVPSDILHPGLYRRLIRFRNEEAAAQGVPVYLILQQKAILGISNLLPSDLHALSRIPWLGKKTIEKYGDRLLEITREYLRTNSDASSGDADDRDTDDRDTDDPAAEGNQEKTTTE